MLLPCCLLLQLQWKTCCYCFWIIPKKTWAICSAVTNCMSPMSGSRISHSEAMIWIPVVIVNECVLAMPYFLSDVSAELATLPLMGELCILQRWGERLLGYCQSARRFWVGSTALIAKAGVICSTQVRAPKRAISDYVGEFPQALTTV